MSPRWSLHGVAGNTQFTETSESKRGTQASHRLPANRVPHSLIMRVKWQHYISQMFSAPAPFRSFSPLWTQHRRCELSALVGAVLKDHPKQESAFSASHETISYKKEIKHIPSSLTEWSSLVIFAPAEVDCKPSPKVLLPTAADSSGNRADPTVLRNGCLTRLQLELTAGVWKCIFWIALTAKILLFLKGSSFHISKQCSWFCRFLSALLILFSYADFSPKIV